MAQGPPLAVLLAAGRGERFGFPKAALEIHGDWILPRLVEALREGGAHKVALVLSPESQSAISERGETGADLVVLNPTPERGRTGSLQAGLRALMSSNPEIHFSALVHPCDVPLLSREVVAALIRAHDSLDSPENRLVRPVTPGGRGGHPLLLGFSRVEELLGFEPDQPLRDLLASHPDSVLDLQVPGPGPFLNVNHPEQLALLESLLGG
jgi:CTP:molybdopterin cytidylyltransferase MocA